MISLDEEYIGTDPNTIIVRSIIVCGGLLCRLNNGNLLGAHFSSIVTPEEILTGCTYLMNHFSGGAAVTEMYFIANLREWQVRGDKYADTHRLARELKLMFNFNGQIKVSDKNIIGNAVDVRYDAGNPTSIGYRITIPNDPLVNTPSNNVKFIRHRRLVVNNQVQHTHTPIVVNTGAPKWHQLPTTTGGFTPFPNSMFVPI